MNTKVSSKGQVIIPKAIRQARGWETGTELVVEERPEGILLRTKSPFKPTTIDDVIGCAGYTGQRKSLGDMERAITEARTERSHRKGGRQ